MSGRHFQTQPKGSQIICTAATVGDQTLITSALKWWYMAALCLCPADWLKKGKETLHTHLTAASGSQRPSHISGNHSPFRLVCPSFCPCLFLLPSSHLFIVPIFPRPFPFCSLSLRLSQPWHRGGSIGVYTQTVGVISVTAILADGREDRHSLASLLRCFLQRAALRRKMSLFSKNKSKLGGSRKAGALFYLSSPELR